ncbi:pectin lyase-like protein [Ascobolus immersus RN42]|uniref:pectate lyase n=1 Tax=Ascobolus immersus RN42 TaxID=1160509 RepID=A0A3N4IB25_ASCIM|nr:pectin lyase-like protein [Ascobolus immersus RN42]
MKFNTLFWFAVAIRASSAAVLLRRASATEAANIGYATLNGGTKGGAGGPTVTVSSLSALESAAKGNDAKIIIIDGSISGAKSVAVGSNKTILGKNSKAALNGVGLKVNKQKNVIIRNLKISKVKASSGDAIAIQASKNVWIDHMDLSSDMNNGKDFYDGLLDITHAADFVTVSNTILHDHFKASLVGHSDSNGSEDKGHLTVTYANNYWKNLNSRAPSFRFGTGHVVNNVFENVSDGVNTRQGAQVLVENNVWTGSKKAIFSTDGGFATVKGNDFGGATNTAPAGSLSKMPYNHSALSASATKSSVQANAGVKLTF